MVRTVVYAKPRTDARDARGAGAAEEKEIPESAAEPVEASGQPEADPYGSKLLKYIPAEVLGGYLPIVIAVDAQRSETNGVKGDDFIVWIVFLIGVIATAGYLGYQASKAPQDERPRPYFYVLAALIAFPAWALVSSEPLRDVSGITAGWAQVIIAVVIFCIPWVDWLVGLGYERVRASKGGRRDRPTPGVAPQR